MGRPQPVEASRLAALDVLIGALVALAVLVAATGGFEVAVGPWTIRSHNVWRVVAIAAVALAIRVWRARRSSGSVFPDPVTWCLLTLTLLSIGYWFKFQLTTVGGADSYGYASAARMLAAGRLVDPAPLAGWLSSPNRLALASPLGWAPAPSGLGIVPTYPLGLPALMMLFETTAGTRAIYWVSPVMGVLTLCLVYRCARRWGDDRTSWLATALVAWNPVFLTYAKQPLSDVPASAWTMLALGLVLQPVRSRPDVHAGAEARWRLTAILAGMAAGAAVLTRPALIVAAGVIPLLALIGPNGVRRMLLTAIGVVTAVIGQMSLQAYLFGGPFTSGYGSADALFSITALPPNLEIYARQSWVALGPIWIGALAVGAWVNGFRPLAAVLALAVAVALPYLFYMRFDHWETLRFLLPGLVPLSILVAIAVTKLSRFVPVAAVSGLLVALFAVTFAVRSERLMAGSSVWEIQALEARYPLAAQWIDANTPPGSVVLADQHSGSLRWYARRQTVRWDLMKADELIPIVGELESHGAPVYAVLEGGELRAFNAKFATALTQLTVDGVGQFRNISFLRLRSR